MRFSPLPFCRSFGRRGSSDSTINRNKWHPVEVTLMNVCILRTYIPLSYPSKKEHPEIHEMEYSP